MLDLINDLLETINELRLRRFSKIILADFRFKLQGSYTKLILPLQFEAEKRLKRTQKSTEA